MGQHRRGVDKVETREGTMNSVDEHTLASQVEAMKDDTAAWGDPEPKPQRPRKSEQRQRGAMVSVRFTEDELVAVQAHAAQRGLSVSGYLRSVALDGAGRPGVSTRWTGRVAANSALTDERLIVRNDETVTYAS
jgi:predicted DNA binding CopG/RHH family protein